MTQTSRPHSHRFDDDGQCTRCDKTWDQVHAEREAANAALREAEQPVNQMLAYAIERKHQDDLSFRRDDYARRGRR